MEFDNFRDIIRFAIDNELEAQTFYEEASARLENPALKQMFDELAGEEKRHRDLLRALYTSNRFGDFFHEDRDFQVADTVEMPALSTDMKPADAFALAMKKEEAAMKEYEALADACRDEKQKRLFLDLAAMERSHKMKMEKAFTDIGFPEVW